MFHQRKHLSIFAKAGLFRALEFLSRVNYSAAVLNSCDFSRASWQRRSVVVLLRAHRAIWLKNEVNCNKQYCRGAVKARGKATVTKHCCKGNNAPSTMNRTTFDSLIPFFCATNDHNHKNWLHNFSEPFFFYFFLAIK